MKTFLAQGRIPTKIDCGKLSRVFEIVTPFGDALYQRPCAV